MRAKDDAMQATWTTPNGDALRGNGKPLPNLAAGVGYRSDIGERPVRQAVVLRILERRFHRIEPRAPGRQFQKHDIVGKRERAAPAPSPAETPMRPGATAAPMAAGCAFIAALFAPSDTSPTAVPRDPHAAPNR